MSSAIPLSFNLTAKIRQIFGMGKKKRKKDLYDKAGIYLFFFF